MPALNDQNRTDAPSTAGPSSAADPSTATSASDRVDTRERLVAAAIRAFARKGIHGASLRAVAAESGARNTAAVHYHFTDREGLLAAVLDRIAEGMREAVSIDEAAGLGLSLRPAPPLQKAVTEAFAPTLTLPLRYPDWGADGLHLLSRILLGDADDLARRFEAQTVRDTDELLAHLIPHLPDLPEAVIRLRLDMAVLSVVCGVVAVRDDDGRGSPTHLANALVDYVAAGLAAPTGAHAGEGTDR